QGVGRFRLRRRAARAGARRSSPHARPAPVLLEERKVGARTTAAGDRRAGLLGDERLPQLRRPLARAALLGRLSSTPSSCDRAAWTSAARARRTATRRRALARATVDSAGFR